MQQLHIRGSTVPSAVLVGPVLSSQEASPGSVGWSSAFSPEATSNSGTVRLSWFRGDSSTVKAPGWEAGMERFSLLLMPSVRTLL